MIRLDPRRIPDLSLPLSTYFLIDESADKKAKSHYYENSADAGGAGGDAEEEMHGLNGKQKEWRNYREKKQKQRKRERLAAMVDANLDANCTSPAAETITENQKQANKNIEQERTGNIFNIYTTSKSHCL